jgi:hypothetical protein
VAFGPGRSVDVTDEPVQDPTEQTDIGRLLIGHCPRGENRLGIHVLEKAEGRVNSKPSCFYSISRALFKVQMATSKTSGMDNFTWTRDRISSLSPRRWLNATHDSEGEADQSNSVTARPNLVNDADLQFTFITG